MRVATNINTTEVRCRCSIVVKEGLFKATAQRNCIINTALIYLIYNAPKYINNWYMQI